MCGMKLMDKMIKYLMYMLDLEETVDQLSMSIVSAGMDM